ncbi:glycosyl hydrolase family 28-related protein [Occultella aeris]|uniref:Pectate lyase superfamily protein n=1 Tax=Occultella aeris TaxID=2761496 RepID=A0A7M4DFI7_9MICO|nr:glycosyl hydrolase family 28-related protein [Occultella aeris]VZO35680.1 Pectate lyase superfamily protein [Occultella aeris]
MHENQDNKPKMTSRRAMLVGAAGLTAALIPAAAAADSPPVAAGPTRNRPARIADLSVNVRTFGATGDGVTDDTAAIVQALESLSDGTGLYFPAGTYLVAPTDPAEFILEIKTNRISIFGESRDTTTIAIADNAGNYWGILGSKVLNAEHWEVRDIAFDHNQQGNPLGALSEYTARLRFSVSSYPGPPSGGFSSAVTIDTVDVINCDSVVSMYFPQGFTPGKNISVVNSRWLAADSQAAGDYDQSLLNLAGENVIVNGCAFEGARWEQAPRTAMEVHATQLSVSGCVVTRFQVGMNLTGISRPSTDYAINATGNAISASRFGIAVWSQAFNGDTDHDQGGAIGVNVGQNSITMRMDKYPTAWAQPRGAAISLYAGSLNNRIGALSVCGNNLVYGNGTDVPALRTEVPSYMAAISIANTGNPSAPVDQLEISGNTVMNAPFAAVVVSSGVVRAAHISDNNLLDCCINSLSSPSTGRASVVFLDSTFLDAPVVRGGKISFHQATTTPTVVYYRDRSTSPKTLFFDSAVDVQSATSDSLTSYVSAYAGMSVVFGSALSGALKQLPTRGANGSRAVHADGRVFKVAAPGQWVSEGYGAQAPSTGAFTSGSMVWNTAPTTGTPVGWVCTQAGDPGTWKGFGTIA